SAGTGGTISPASGWYNSGAVVAVSATANSGAQFTGFGGALGGTTTPQTLTLNAPLSVTATFSVNSGGLSCTTPGNGNFTGCYYKDSSWTNLALVRTDASINFDWAYGSPDPALTSTK